MTGKMDPLLSCPTPIDHADIVQLAHGGGGSLTSRLIERVFVPAFRNEFLDQLGDGAVVPLRLAAPRIHDRHVRGEAALLSGRRHRLSGRARDRERPRHVRRRAALPERRPRDRGRLSDADLKRLVASMAAAAPRSEWPWSPATRRWWIAGRATASSSIRRGSGSFARAFTWAPAARRPAT